MTQMDGTTQTSIRCRVPWSQQSTAERKTELFLQFLRLSVQLQRPLVFTFRKTLAADSSPPPILLQALHFLLPSSSQQQHKLRGMHHDVREGGGLLTSDVRVGVLWSSSLTDKTGHLRATIMLLWPTTKLSLTPLL